MQGTYRLCRGIDVIFNIRSKTYIRSTYSVDAESVVLAVILCTLSTWREYFANKCYGVGTYIHTALHRCMQIIQMIQITKIIQMHVNTPIHPPKGPHVASSWKRPTCAIRSKYIIKYPVLRIILLIFLIDYVINQFRSAKDILLLRKFFLYLPADWLIFLVSLEKTWWASNERCVKQENIYIYIYI